MALRGKAHWKDCADYYERYKPTATEVYPKEENIKYDQYTKAFGQIGPVPSTEGRLMTVVEQVVIFEQNILRTLKGLSPACEFYAKLLLHGMYQFLEQLRGLQTATEQATQTFATSQAEELFHPHLEALLVTWLSNKLPEIVRKRAHNRRPQPSARVLLTEFYFTLFPQPDDQAKHLGNIARNPTSTSQNPTDVIVNIETWRTSIQMLKDISGHIPMKEDIRSAFEKLIAPLVKNNADFSLTRTLCGRETYMSITTTDDNVYKYILSIMEAIHKLPKNTKWESTKPKAQAINTGTGKGVSGPNKEKGKGKGKKKGPLLPEGKGNKGKGKGKGKSQSSSKPSTPAPEGKGQSKSSNLGGKSSGGTGGKPSGDPVKKKPKQCAFYASPAGCIRGKSCPFLHQNDSVTKKPLPADPADVQRLKGKPQSVPKPTTGGATNPAPGVPASSSGATSSTTPALVPQLSMIRVDRHHLEPEPEPLRRHPVADWRPHGGPTRENHPKFLLSTAESMKPMSIHMAGQHFEHIVFGANQHACWLRCTLCEKISPRIYYRFTICMKCQGRRREDHEPLWHISTRCVLMKWNCLLLRLFWMGTEDRRAFFARELKNVRSRRHVDDFDNMELFYEAIEEESYMDDLRAEVSLLEIEQEETSLADRFSRGGLPYRRDPPYEGSGPASYNGRPMNEAAAREDTISAHLNRNELDETRSNEAHLLHDTHFQDPCNTQGPCPSKPIEGVGTMLTMAPASMGQFVPRVLVSSKKVREFPI